MKTRHGKERSRGKEGKKDRYKTGLLDSSIPLHLGMSARFSECISNKIHLIIIVAAFSLVSSLSGRFQSWHTCFYKGILLAYVYQYIIVIIRIPFQQTFSSFSRTITGIQWSIAIIITRSWPTIPSLSLTKLIIVIPVSRLNTIFLAADGKANREDSDKSLDDSYSITRIYTERVNFPFFLLSFSIRCACTLHVPKKKHWIKTGCDWERKKWNFQLGDMERWRQLTLEDMIIMILFFTDSADILLNQTQCLYKDPYFTQL